MKKTFALMLITAVTTTVSAQDKLQKGDLIYGTVTEDGKPVAGVLVTERNANDRIMAQTTTDVNGQYSFRLANPRNTIVVTYPGYETVDIAIKKQSQDISIRKQASLPPVEVIDYPMLDLLVNHPILDNEYVWLDEFESLDNIVDEYPNMELINYWKSDAGSKNKAQDIYLPYRDNIIYGSIQELFDNLYLDI